MKDGIADSPKRTAISKNPLVNNKGKIRGEKASEMGPKVAFKREGENQMATLRISIPVKFPKILYSRMSMLISWSLANRKLFRE